MRITTNHGSFHKMYAFCAVVERFLGTSSVLTRDIVVAQAPAPKDLKFLWLSSRAAEMGYGSSTKTT